MTIAFIKSSVAEASNARLASGLASLRTCIKCSCDFNWIITLQGAKTSVISPGIIFVLNLSRLLIDC